MIVPRAGPSKLKTSVLREPVHDIGLATHVAPLRCLAMLSISNNVAARVTVTAEELEAALHKALRTHPECKGVRLLKVTRLENKQGLANWGAEFSAQPGTGISPDCRGVLISIKQGVQKHFDLASSG